MNRAKLSQLTAERGNGSLAVLFTSIVVDLYFCVIIFHAGLFMVVIKSTDLVVNLCSSPRLELINQ